MQQIPRSLINADRELISLWFIQEEIDTQELEHAITAIGINYVYKVTSPFVNQGISLSKIFLCAVKLFDYDEAELPQLLPFDKSYVLAEREQSTLFRLDDKYVVKFHDEPNTLFEEANAYSKISSVNNPYFPQFYGLYAYNNNIALVMEYFEGCSIEDFVTKTGTIQGIDSYGIEIRSVSESTVVKLMRQIFEASLYLQSKGLYHNDLMIGNVLTDGKSIRFIDFGGNTQERFASSRSLKMIASYAFCSLKDAEWLLQHDPMFIVYNVQSLVVIDFILYMLGLPMYEEGIDEEVIDLVKNPALREIIKRNSGRPQERLTLSECYDLL